MEESWTSRAIGGLKEDRTIAWKGKNSKGEARGSQGVRVFARRVMQYYD